MRWVDSVLCQRLVNILDAHLSRDPEESGDHVVRLEDPVHVHTMNVQVEVLAEVDLSEWAEKNVPPLPQKVLGLFLQARRIIVVLRLKSIVQIII